MENSGKDRSNSLMRQGILMIAIGTIVCALGSLMAKPLHEQFGYVVAGLLTTLCLISGVLSLRMQNKQILPQRMATAYLGAAAAVIVCSALYWLIQAGFIDIPVLGVLAAFVGLLWGGWYIWLAFQLQSTHYARSLCMLAAATSSLGIILATRTGVTRLSVVTVVGCFMIVLGVQAYVTAGLLHRELARQRAFQQR